MWKLPAMYVGTYAEKDAELTLALFKNYLKKLKHKILQSI